MRRPLQPRVGRRVPCAYSGAIRVENLLPNVAQDLTTYTRKNLDKFLNNTTEMSGAYCACLTVRPDDPEQWKTYAELGRGFAIGFNLTLFLSTQVPALQRREPFVVCVPVTYNQRD
jgi:hypothetical protein